MQAPLPTAFHVTTPHGAIGLWWRQLSGAAREQQRAEVRQQAAQILNRQFPASSLGQIHWPPGAQHPPDLAYAAQSWHAPTSSPDLWLSRSYLPLPAGEPGQALLAIGPLPLGVDVTAAGLLDEQGWAEVLQLYGGPAGASASDTHACATRWAGIEAADKCLRTGLREWSQNIDLQRSRCTVQALPLPAPDLAAALAWRAPEV